MVTDLWFFIKTDILESAVRLMIFYNSCILFERVCSAYELSFLCMLPLIVWISPWPLYISVLSLFACITEACSCCLQCVSSLGFKPFSAWAEQHRVPGGQSPEQLQPVRTSHTAMSAKSPKSGYHVCLAFGLEHRNGAKNLGGFQMKPSK